MDTVNPFLTFLFHIRLGLKSGQSIVEIMDSWEPGNSDFDQDVSYWWTLYSVNPGNQYSLKTDYRRILQSILVVGLDGGSILATLDVLEVDLKQRIEQDRLDYNEKLKFHLMLPLLLLVFPALLIMMLGPTLSEIVGVLSQ